MRYLLPISALLLCGSIHAQTFFASNYPAGVTVINTENMTSNNTDSAGVTAVKKTLGNCGVDFSGGVVTPAGFPVGQLWCTAADKTAGEGHGGPTQNPVSATIAGTGTTAMDNGHGSGGTDSPVTVTATYGGSTDDAVCTGDANHSFPTPYVGLAPAACVANSSGVFAQSTAVSHGNSDVLSTAVFGNEDAALDTATNVELDQYWCVDDLPTLHDFEFEPNINSSSASYTAGTGGFTGPGFHWNETAVMFQVCPQNCVGWTTIKLHDITGANADLTTYALTNGHCYHTRNYAHRLPGCSFNSVAPCVCYDYLQLSDVTAGGAPITWAIRDTATNTAFCFTPVDNHTFAAGTYDHIQTDMVTANALTQVRVINHTMRWFKLL